MTESFDFALSHNPLAAIIEPLTDAARDWCANNLLDDEQRLVWGGFEAIYVGDGDYYRVDHRDAMDIVEAFVADGLTAQGTREMFA